MRTVTSGRINLSMLIKPTPSNLKYTKNRSDENSHVWEDQPQYVDKAYTI